VLYSQACIQTFLIAFIALFLFTGCNIPATSDKSRKVFIAKTQGRYTLYRNGQPFRIRGGAGYTFLPQLKAAGGNTIRTWDTVGLGAILDEAQHNNLAVIAGLPMPASSYVYDFYQDKTKVEAQYKAFNGIVQRYKHHPALLMWCVGNELDFPYRLRYRPFYRSMNRLVKMIHATDPDHPVTTTIANFSRREIVNLRLKIPELDLISINTFGALHTLRGDLDMFSWFWDGPYLISEWGIPGPWESEYTAWDAPIENTSTKKAEQYRNLYEKQVPHNDPRCLGDLVFFWGQKQERTPSWFSLFSEKGEFSAAAGVLRQLWTGRPPEAKAPQLQYMLVDGKGAKDNILCKPGSLHTASILMPAPDTAIARLHWKVQQEDWYAGQDTLRTWLDTTVLSPGMRRLTFAAPLKEGPYRIYIDIFDKHGNFATANTPFYVVEE
jgi:hypothetical protein